MAHCGMRGRAGGRVGGRCADDRRPCRHVTLQGTRHATARRLRSRRYLVVATRAFESTAASHDGRGTQGSRARRSEAGHDDEVGGLRHALGILPFGNGGRLLARGSRSLGGAVVFPGGTFVLRLGHRGSSLPAPIGSIAAGGIAPTACAPVGRLALGKPTVRIGVLPALRGRRGSPIATRARINRRERLRRRLRGILPGTSHRAVATGISGSCGPIARSGTVIAGMIATSAISVVDAIVDARRTRPIVGRR